MTKDHLFIQITGALAFSSIRLIGLEIHDMKDEDPELEGCFRVVLVSDDFKGRNLITRLDMVWAVTTYAEIHTNTDIQIITNPLTYNELHNKVSETR